MTESKIPMHFVSTIEQARRLVEGRTDFWVSRCQCRDGAGTCKQSRHDVCLEFEPMAPMDQHGRRSLTRAEVDELFAHAATARLVPRPFRGFEDRTRVYGICFCCADCCSYFHGEDEPCGRGASVETTDLSQCNGCGLCVEVCHFGARRMQGGELVVDTSACYGCGLCADVCPEECVAVVER